MKTHFLFLALLLFGSSYLCAQNTIDQLKKNPDVVWIQSYLIELDPSKDYAENKSIGLNSGGSIVLKRLAKPEEGADNYTFQQSYINLPKLIFQQKSQLQIFKNMDLKEPYSAKETAAIGARIDTVITFDPNLFEEVKQLSIREIDANTIDGMYQYGVIYYHKKDKEMYTLPLSMAPTMSVYDEKGERKERKALFWIPISSTQQMDIHSRDIRWVNRAVFNINTSGEDLILHKKEFLPSVCWEDLIQDIKAKGNRNLYHVGQVLGSEKYTAREIKNLGSSVDTIVTFDPNTFEEMAQISRNYLNAKNISQTRMVQDWIWDEQKKILFVRSMGYAPIIDRYDNQGKLINKGPIFYLRMDHVK